MHYNIFMDDIGIHFYLCKHFLSYGSVSRDNLISRFIFGRDTKQARDKTISRRLKNFKEHFGLTEIIRKEWEGSVYYTISDDDKENLKNNIGCLFKFDGDEYPKFVLSFMDSFLDRIDLFEKLDMSDYISDVGWNEYNDVIKVPRYPLHKFKGDKGVLEEIIKCAKNISDMKFMYTRLKENGSYEVKGIPFFITFFDGNWYLVLEDSKDDKLKKYRIDKITKPIQLHTKLIDYDKKSDDDWENRVLKRQEVSELLDEKGGTIFWHSNEKVKTVIRIDKDVAHHFRENDYGFSQEVSSINEDGSVDVSFMFSSFEEFHFTMSSWIPKFMVLEPLEYKEKFISVISEGLRKNTM